MSVKKWIITVDTEGDNLWKWKPGEEITTENAKCIARFQNLCEQYSFKPVYLVNFEMAQSDVLVSTLKNKVLEGKCEIGMHLHAWNSPPAFDLPKLYVGCPYITEYPKEVVMEKHIFLRDYIEERFAVRPVTYRAGRWATNATLFDVLDELGFLVDCSITPGINLSWNQGMSVPNGNDYSMEKHSVKKITDTLIEVPMTTCKRRSVHGKTLKNRLSNLLKGRDFWLRPAINTYSEMIHLINIMEGQQSDYLEFMIHSSELLPNGSPYCKTEEDVEEYYKKMEAVFQHVSRNYVGVTLHEYYDTLIKNGGH